MIILRRFFSVVGFLLFFLVPMSVYARNTHTAFDRPLDVLVRVFTGPIAFAVSVLGIVVCGAILVFGGEIGDCVKRFLILILVISLIMFSTTLLIDFFGVSGMVL